MQPTVQQTRGERGRKIINDLLRNGLHQHQHAARCLSRCSHSQGKSMRSYSGNRFFLQFQLLTQLEQD